jgi:alcohol dehydrogenase class IV
MTDAEITDTGGFTHAHPRCRIVFGAGAHRQLPQLLAEAGARSVFVVCGRTVGAGPQLAALRAALGAAVVGVFDGVRPHAGAQHLAAAADELERSGADAVVSLGGGAAIDTAKYLILLRSADGDLGPYEVPRGQGHDGRPARALAATRFVHIAIPTTAGSSSEIMPWAGVRDEERGEKVLFRDPLLVPDVALLDPEMVVHTGPELTATSGATALARAVESMYSRDRQPIAEAYALQAIRLLSTGLPRSIADGADLAARGDALLGSTLSGIAADNAMVSLTHAVGHAVGGRYALQHGIAHRILLPAAARMLLPAADTAVARLADVLHLPDASATAVADRLEEMLAAMPIPHRLRDVGTDKDDLDELVAMTTQEPMMAFLPRPVEPAELGDLLRSCW